MHPDGYFYIYLSYQVEDGLMMGFAWFYQMLQDIYLHLISLPRNLTLCWVHPKNMRDGTVPRFGVQRGTRF